MKYALIAGVLLVLFVAVIFAIGAMLPVKHEAQRTTRLTKSPAEVYAVVAGPNDWLPGKQVAYEQVEADPPRKLVTRISDKSLPFGGTWTYDLKQAGAGTELTITENGEVYNPLFRFVSKYIMGHTATIDQYLAALRKKLE